jgi:hypothetical protein
MIVGHVCNQGVVKYEMMNNGRKISVSGDEIVDTSEIRRYWRSLAFSENGMALPPATHAMLKTPTEIMEMMEIQGTLHLLTKFPDLDTPVYVPLQTLKNGHPQLLIDFFEERVRKAARR